MQNLGLWGDVSHLLQKQHETVLLVVKSYKMWFWGGVANSRNDSNSNSNGKSNSNSIR